MAAEPVKPARWWPLAVLAAASCLFEPDLSRYPPCSDAGTCAAGASCLMEAKVCVPDCVGSACDVDADGGRDGGPADAGLDAGGSDAGGPDAGADAGLPDSGADAGASADAGSDGGVDAGGTDAGAPDAGARDAGVSDGGGGTLGLNVPPRLQDALQGLLYVWFFDVDGGVGPYSVFLVDGGLPPGVVTGNTPPRLVGTPTQVGHYELVLLFTDSVLPHNQRLHTTSVDVLADDGGLKILTQGLLDGFVGAPYSARLIAAGATPPYAWVELSGADAGLSLTDAIDAGRYSGVPTVPGAHSVMVQVEAASGERTSRSLSYTVH